MKKEKGRWMAAILMVVGIGVFLSLTTIAPAEPPGGVPPGLEIGKGPPDNVPPGPPGGELTLEELQELGQKIFFEETFEGNGRTCGTCHPEENNFTIDPAFIATLPFDDPLFVAENNPDLAGLENPTLMRSLGLILENLNGFDQDGVLRGVPHTLALRTSLNPDGNVSILRAEATGWSGDGSPAGAPENGEDGSLRAFAIGAVRQHFPKTLDRVEGVDFRLPTEEELDALEAFMLSLGRQGEINLETLYFTNPVVERGKDLFNGEGKCLNCHFNAGANTMTSCNTDTCVNGNFATGVESQEALPSFLIDDTIPFDDGFEIPPDIDNAAFNAPVLVEAADTPPFFHNNSAFTIEAAVGFFNTSAFNNSPSGRFLGGISLDGSQVVAIASFLRALNALENIRLSILQDQRAMMAKLPEGKKLLVVSAADTEDAIEVLTEGNVFLFPQAVAFLGQALELVKQAQNERVAVRNQLLEQSIALRKDARDLILE